MSVGRILTLGYGSFGGVNFLPTLGYLASTTPIPPPVVTAKTGTGGIDPGEGLKRRTIVKPTGLLGPKKKAKKEPFDAPVVSRETSRTDDVALIITPENKPIFAPIATMSQAEIHAEIGRLLHEKIRTDDDEFIFLLLMMATE